MLFILFYFPTESYAKTNSGAVSATILVKKNYSETRNITADGRITFGPYQSTGMYCFTNIHNILNATHLHTPSYFERQKLN